MGYRKHIRLANYDYKQNGYYFITICTARNAPLLNEYKDMIIEELVNLEKRFLGVKLDFNEIMEDHIHFILYFHEANISLPCVIQAFKSITTLKAKQAKECVAAELALPMEALGAKQALQLRRLWQPNYYEHIIRNESALNKIREYIMNNPEKERYDWDKLDVV